MNRLSTSLTGAWLVFFLGACSSDPADAGGSGGASTIAGGGGSIGSSSGGAGSPGGDTSTGSATSSTGSQAGAGGQSGAGSQPGAGGQAGTGSQPGAGGRDNGGGGTAGGDGAGGTANPGAGGGTNPAECPSTAALAAVVRPELVLSGPDNYWQEGVPTSGGSGTAVTVTAEENQTWHGFGGTFNEAGWDALSVLSAEDQQLAIRLLFSVSEGAKIDWGRIPMGSSDYAMSRYTLADTADDYEMTNFSLGRDREMLIPFIHAAQTIKPDIKFWGSPWTPPPWMKTSGDYNGGSMKSDAMTLQAHALYFSRWVEDYNAACIPIDHVQPQNEPGYETRYPSCLWGSGLLGTFVGDYLGPTFEARGLDTDIWFGTLSNDQTYQSHIGGLTGAAAGFVTGVGLQWNTINQTGTLSNQGYLVMQTEHKCGNYPWESASFNSTMAPNDHAYGEESWGLIKEWLTAGVHIYSAWNMVLDTLGQNLDEQRPWPQNAMLIVDRDAKTLTPTAYYYVFRHLSQFIDPGAVRMSTSGGDALAFRNPDGSNVVVVHNGGSGADTTTVTVGGASYSFDIPGRGWATLNVTN